MTDPVIPEDAVDAAARVLHAQDCGGVGCEDLTRTEYRNDARAILAAALPHLRPEADIRREVAEEIARAMYRTLSVTFTADGEALIPRETAAAIAREIGARS